MPMHGRPPRRLATAAPLPKGTFADPVLRHRYGGQLEVAAETFLLAAFEGEARNGFGGEAAGPPPALVSAAMHILNRSAWTQPTDEQVRAAIYLGQQAESTGSTTGKRAA